MWVIIQLEVFLTPLLATVLQLIEHFNQCIKQHKESLIKIETLLTEPFSVYRYNSAKMLIFVDFLSDFFWPNSILQ